MTTNNAINIPLPVSVSNGGTGDASFTAYSVLCGGTTSTGVLQNVSGIGTSNQVLTSQGAGALPQWATSPARAIIQIQSTTKTSVFSTSSSTFTAITGMSVSITPTYTSSLILIIYHLNVVTPGGTTQGYIQLNRGTTPICVGDVSSSNNQATSGSFYLTTSNMSTSSMNFLDNPATTSSTTYNLYCSAVSSGTLFVNESSASTGTTLGAFASSITAMEVAVL